MGRPGALGSLVSAAMAETQQSTSLAPERVAEMVREGAPVVDVRSANEHTAGHIPGDRPIPFDQLKDEAASLPQDQPVILYCRSGERSGAAVQALRVSGFDAYNIEGGLLEWAAQGLPLEPADGEVAERDALPPA
jgi:rhodanese-related sulfurtransferase